jgi:hypothetical protein
VDLQEHRQLINHALTKHAVRPMGRPANDNAPPWQWIDWVGVGTAVLCMAAGATLFAAGAFLQ